MKSAWAAILSGFPAAVTTHITGISPWLVFALIIAALMLGLVQTIFPQDSADRRDLLLALRKSNNAAGRTHRAEPPKNLDATDLQTFDGVLEPRRERAAATRGADSGDRDRRSTGHRSCTPAMLRRRGDGNVP